MAHQSKKVTEGATGTSRVRLLMVYKSNKSNGG